MTDPITRRVTPGQDPATRLGAKPAATPTGAAHKAIDQVGPTGAGAAASQDAAAVKAKAGPDATAQAIADAKPAKDADLGAALDKLKGKDAAKPKEAGSLQRFKENDPAAVKEVQQKLKDLGHYQGEVDGKYGAATDKAVREFQAKNQDAEGKALKVDGAAGPKTLAAIDKQAAAAKPPAGGDQKPAVTPERATALAQDPKLDAAPVGERAAAAEVAPQQADAQKLATSAMTTDPASLAPKGVENAARTSPQATELVGDVAARREETPNQVVAAMRPDSAAALAGVHAQDGNPSAAAQTVYAVKPEAQPAVAAQAFQGPNGGAAATSFLGKAMAPASQGTPNALENVDSGTLRNAISAIDRDRGQPGVGTRATAAANAARRVLAERGETP